MNRLRPIKGRRPLGNARRARPDLSRPEDQVEVDRERPLESQALARRGVGWDQSAALEPAPFRDSEGPEAPLTARILSLLSDPRIDFLTVATAADALALPRQDIENALESMRQAGLLVAIGGGSVIRYGVPPETKAELEAEFRAAAQELGEHGLLARMSTETALVPFEDEEPRLPATAGLLSLFLPGTGQLLNGDIGRASLVFAVWSLAWITHLSPVWTFVCLYAGAEAFLTAKIRSMERKMAEETAPGVTGPKKLPSPRPT
jgi:hypothetical protein